MKFDSWRAGEMPKTAKLNPDNVEISSRRAELNKKFGRTGDLNKDITIRGHKEMARDWLESKGFDLNRSKILIMESIIRRE